MTTDHTSPTGPSNSFPCGPLTFSLLVTPGLCPHRISDPFLFSPTNPSLLSHTATDPLFPTFHLSSLTIPLPHSTPLTHPDQPILLNSPPPLPLLGQHVQLLPSHSCPKEIIFPALCCVNQCWAVCGHRPLGAHKASPRELYRRHRTDYAPEFGLDILCWETCEERQVR